MQVNRVQNQPNFGSVQFGPELKQAIKQGLIPAKKLELLKNFEKKYADSEVTALIGMADVGTKSSRIDAQVYYRKPGRRDFDDRGFSYLAENVLSYFMKIKPQGFLNKVSREIECLEETYALR